MASSLKFQDHEEFHRAALHMAATGLAVGLAVHVASALYPPTGGVAGPWGLAALVAGTAFGAADPARRVRARHLIVLLAAGAVVGATLAVTRGATLGAGTGGLVVALGLGGLLAREGRRRPATFIAAATVALVCLVVLAGALAMAANAGAPGWAAATLAGGAFGFVAVLGTLPRHVVVGTDRVEEAYRGCATATGEVRELADRGLALWQRVEPALEATSPVRRAIETSLVRLFDLARRWASVEHDGGRTPADALVDRLAQLDDRLARTEDEIARTQYERARAALAEQLRYVRDIATARERVVARMHHYLAALERLRLAALNHRSADASRQSADVRPILDDLDHLGREIDCASEALGEVERDDERAAPPAAPSAGA